MSWSVQAAPAAEVAAGEHLNPMEMMMMKRNTFGLGLGLLAALVLFALAATANTLPAARYAEMMTVEMMDTDKDGMVSREEFLAAAGKMFDMAAEHMKAKDGKMTSQQLRQFRSALATDR